jgi:hypothetical protein
MGLGSAGAHSPAPMPSERHLTLFRHVTIVRSTCPVTRRLEPRRKGLARDLTTLPGNRKRDVHADRRLRKVQWAGAKQRTSPPSRV